MSWTWLDDGAACAANYQPGRPAINGGAAAGDNRPGPLPATRYASPMSKRQKPPVADSKSPPATSPRLPWVLPLGLAAVAAAGFLIVTATKSEAAPAGSYRVVATYPHKSSKTYTQGLEMVDGILFESTGQMGEADWRVIDLETGDFARVPGSNREHRYGLGSQYFGEGITIWNKSRLIQLTWQNRVGFVWDVAPIFDGLQWAGGQPEQFEYPEGVKEGWGLTRDSTRLIMSTGSPDGKLYFLDPGTLKSTGSITVTDGGKPVAKLNELEYVDGYVYANVYMTEDIVKIDVSSGKVAARYRMTGLLSEADRSKLKQDEVLNGIAYDPARKVFLVTGKNWPKLFAVEFVEP